LYFAHVGFNKLKVMPMVYSCIFKSWSNKSCLHCKYLAIKHISINKA